MSDTIQSLDEELQREKKMNARLLDLLLRTQAALPDPDGCIGPMIDEVKRTKGVLDNCQQMLERKRRGEP
jgi:hypothetical protein